jgi:hypothetical protein
MSVMNLIHPSVAHAVVPPIGCNALLGFDRLGEV